MAYHTTKMPMGISYDLLVKVDNFIFLANYVVLYCEVKFKMPIILWRLFFDMGRALVVIKKKKLKFRLNDEEVTFSVCRMLRQVTDMRVVSVIDCVDDP